jgi:hypothetical protein
LAENFSSLTITGETAVAREAWQFFGERGAVRMTVDQLERNRPSGVKALVLQSAFMARLKSCPFKTASAFLLTHAVSAVLG